LNLRFEVEPGDIDEGRLPGEAPAVYVERLSREKAGVAAAGDVVAIGADTAVVHEGHVMGKPGHPEEARSMLRRLQGDVHEVFTGVAIACGGQLESLVDVTTVKMLPMTVEEIAGYVDTGEPMGKAGAYALQGRGGVFVESIGGSPFTVIGLPLHLLPRLAHRVGADLDQFDRRSSL
jgi:septum formation protein